MNLKAIVLSLFVLSFSQGAFAQWFPATVNISARPDVVAAEVVNPYFNPIICNGQVFGQTAQGPVFHTFFAEQIMPVGAHRYAFVHTNAFAPFVNGWAQIHCRFAGWL